MHSVGVIPARYGSKRLPGKPLALIGDKPMIQHVWDSANQAETLDELIVATDDDRIFQVVNEFGGKAVKTSSEFRSGSDRIGAVVGDMKVDVVVNIQGDEPFIEPSIIDDLVRTFEEPNVVMSTPVRRSDEEDDLSNPNIVKVEIDDNWDALNFSRSPISGSVNSSFPHEWIHIGVYGYTHEFLMKYVSLEQTPREISENLEQLRAIENGYKIRLIETSYHAFPIDTEVDLERANKLMNKLAMERTEG